MAILVAALALYAARRVIAREALTGWLQSKGIASEAEIEAFGLTGATARLRIGDPANPDFTAERVEVGYALRGFGVEVGSVKLTRPVLRASLRDGRLSAGVLDPLIEEFRRRPPRPEATKPRIEVDDGELRLATDYGPVRLTADALVNDGKLMSLAAASAPARLRGRDFEVVTGPGVLRLTTRGARATASLGAPVGEARAGGAALTTGRLRITAEAPYPDLQKKRSDGPVVLRASLTGQRMALGEQELEDAELTAAFTGDSAGWIPDLTVRGRADAELRAGSADLAGGTAGLIRAGLSTPDLVWTRKGGDAVAATVRLTGAAQAIAVSDLRLRTVSATLEGPAAWRRGEAEARLAGGLEGRGGWMGLGAPTAADSAEIAAVKRGVRSFRAAATGLTVRFGKAGLQLGLTGPARLNPDAGGEARLAPRGAGWTLTVAGGGLPKVDADIRRFVLLDGGATASGRVKAALSIGPIQGGVFDASGTLRMGEGVRFTGDRCASVTATRLELGENDVEGLSGRLCPVAGEPLLTLNGGDWRIAGRAEDAAATVPFLQARVAEADGRIVMGLARGRLHATAAIADAMVADTGPETRFHPLRMTGRAVLARDVWTADLAFRTPAGQPVATARLGHQSLTGAGGVEIDTGLLAFAEGGLQPEQLSPLAAAVGSPAVGLARFAGQLQWAGAGLTSGGTLTVPRLDFTSPAGRVSGLSGEVVFTSLAPLTAAPGQELRAEAVDAVLPLTGVTATFGLEDGGLLISGGEAAVGGGRVTVESVRIPLGPDEPARGVLNFEGVQLHDIVEASPFGDRVEFDARVSGRVPFEAKGQQVRILGGSLRAIQPGRISIQRAALTGVSAEGAVATPGAPAAVAPEPSTDTFTDFAYQAMENLAFDTLDATIESRPDGRLGVIFHIVGRHDPPKRQEIRLGLMDLIRRDFMNRKLPLPSGTGVNLTLDTTLNLDDLLKDFAEYQRLRSSPPVQP
ncbi:intermembrane phospholipid transport protein YdbH family protein [Phenylobacterium sp.]|uniref:intermembrane phospholipid transport protein YdbH family protein n=1 Tax=Phenylobacterium sp. TaxID=1871053 RepID=UPI002FE3457F